MASRKSNLAEASVEPISKATTDDPERFKLTAIGANGLLMFNGVSTEEYQRDLQWPVAAKTYKKMQYSTPINACLNLYDNLISKVNWRVVAPKDATEEEKKQAEFISECLDDMDTTFRQVIKDALTSNTYGFAVLEKVYRRRNKNSGSMYSDNKIALKKLAIRNQETIDRFVFDADGNEVIGVKQNLSGYSGVRYDSKKNKEIIIPRSKFWHITAGRGRGDPFGKSPLRDVYIAWKYLEVLSELEASGVQKDLIGLPLLRVPAQLLSEDATPAQKAILENLKNILRNLQMGTQSGVLLPSAVDEATRTSLFDLELLSTEGSKKSFDIDKIKNYYQNQIYTSLFADVLILGSNGVGSFALGQIKNSLTGSAVESMLDNIVESFNRDVIRQLYELNGWNPARAAKLDYENLHSTDLETLSKYIQRTSSVGMLPRTHEVVNAIVSAIGLDEISEDTDLDDVLPESSSRSGEGGATPFEGTRTSIGTENSSDLNLDNTA